MSERILSPRELNRALLARQLLLERASVSVPKALERVGGIQAQHAPSSYIGLWSRIEGFERDALTRALERRQVVQGTLMRATIHLVSKRDYWPIALAIRHSRREAWLKVKRSRGMRDADMARLAKRVRSHFGGEHRRREELGEVVDQLAKDGTWAWNGVGLWLDLVRVPPSGTWERRRADLYGLADEWIGSTEVSEEEGLALLARRYLGGFGPASLKDLVSWSGVPAPAFAPVLDGMRLRRLRDEQGNELIDLPRALLPDAETPAPARFLPTWDATLLAHARRTEILPERFRTRVFNPKTPHSISTFLVDGQVAGSWREERGKVVIEPFGRLSRAARRELDEEAERLRAFMA
jgi:hypothetical protein